MSGKLGPFGGLIREMWEAGKLDEEIADELALRGVVVDRSTISAHRLSRGMMPGNRLGRLKLDEATRNRMRQVRERDKLTWPDLGRRFGVSHVTAIKYCR